MSFDKLNELLDIPSEETPVVPEVVAPADLVPVAATPRVSEVPPALPDLEDDVSTARKTINDAITQVTVALGDAISLAQSQDNPRAYEVVGNMLTAIVNANKELVDIHRVREDTLSTNSARTGKGAGAPAADGINIEKAVFIGRPQDLIRELRKATKELKAADDAKA